MKIILAPDSFKGSLTQQQVIEGLEKAAKRRRCMKIVVLDGWKIPAI